jgi:AcrR family transcriptional regulator
MAYEVTKQIGGRAYRYGVESVRDPQTGKRRNRWTYLGRAEQGAAAVPARRPRTNARERLLDAVERLVAGSDFAALTADAIATEAGLAHGTFYRHFRDKRDALRGALDRIRERGGPVIDSLRDDVETAVEARAAIRSLVERILRAPAEHPALLRAYYGLVLRDEEVASDRRERRGRTIARLSEHLAALASRGLIHVADVEATSTALFAMLDGFYREAIVDGVPLDERRIAAAADVTERAVFGEVR